MCCEVLLRLCVGFWNCQFSVGRSKTEKDFTNWFFIEKLRLDAKDSAHSSAERNVWFWKKKLGVAVLTFVTCRNSERMSKLQALVSNEFLLVERGRLKAWLHLRKHFLYHRLLILSPSRPQVARVPRFCPKRRGREWPKRFLLLYKCSRFEWLSVHLLSVVFVL